MIGDSYAAIQGRGTSDPYIKYTGNYPPKSKYVYISNTNDTVDYLDENGNIRVNAASASLPGLGSGSFDGSFSGGDNGYAGFDALGNISVGTNGNTTTYKINNDLIFI